MPKASIGDVKYMTLQEAIRVAKPGDVIQILDNLAFDRDSDAPENVGMTGDGLKSKFPGKTTSL